MSPCLSPRPISVLCLSSRCGMRPPVLLSIIVLLSFSLRVRPQHFLHYLSSSLLITRPYQLFVYPLSFRKPASLLGMCSFLILPLRVTPHIHRSILMLFISICVSCSPHFYPTPYSIAGLITFLPHIASLA